MRALRVLVALLALAVGGARANGLDLTELRLQRADDGLLLDFNVRLELPRAVDEALHKGVPLHFVADVDVYRARWYWRDLRVAQATRTWRLSWQPLTLTYRVSLGALGQSYATLAEALGALRRSARWRVGEPLAADDDGRYYAEFSYRLDTSLLPRPLQIGLAGQPDWQLAARRTLPLPDAAR